jgi:2,3-dihydroxybenzoate-AMP ligase
MNPEQMVPWPADLAGLYRRAGCWRGRPLGSYLWEWAQRWGERAAVVDGDRRLTYAGLAQRADSFAEGLAGLGVGRGDSVLVQLPNCWEFVAVILGCFRLGVVPAMMLPPHRETELASVGAHVEARALIVPRFWHGYDHERLAQLVAATLPRRAQVLVVGDAERPGSVDVRPLLRPRGGSQSRRRWLDARAPDSASPALFLLSGGTTGLPKVIGRTHDDYEYNIRRVSDVCEFGLDTVYLAALPAGHNFALANPGILGTLFGGGRVVMLASPRPAAVFSAVAAERVTVTSAVPAVVLRWMSEAGSQRYDLSSLRYVQVGGSILAPETAARIGSALGCGIQQMYGMAEGLICCTTPEAPDEIALTSQGSPISPYDELLVVASDGRQAGEGEIGELLSRGPYTTRGYYGAPEVNALSFTSDGWYRTGDLVRITPDGRVVVCGRVKDLINRAGEKIAAAEVESLAQAMPQVAEAAVVAMPDEQVGERVCLCVRLRQDHQLTLDDVRAAFAAAGVAAFKIPERLELMDRLPHTPVGKPDKNALLKLLPR